MRSRGISRLLSSSSRQLSTVAQGSAKSAGPPQAASSAGGTAPPPPGVKLSIPTPAPPGAAGPAAAEPAHGSTKKDVGWLKPALALAIPAAGYVAYSNDEVRQQVGQQLAALQQQVLPGKAPQAPWKEHTQDAGFVMQGDQAAAVPAQEEAATTAALQVEEQQPEVQPQEQDATASAAEPVTRIDSPKLAQLFQEVFQPAAAPAPAPAPAAAPTAAPAAAPAAAAAKAAAAHADAPAAAEAAAEAVAAAATAAAQAYTMAAQQAAVPAAAAEGTEANVADAAAAVAAVVQQGKAEDGSAQLPLFGGVAFDVSPAGLVRHAIEQQAGAGGDWSSYEAQLRQARADAATFAAALQQVQATHQQELTKAQAQVEAARAHAAHLAAQGEALAERFKALLAAQQEAAEGKGRQDVRRAEQQVTLAAGEAVVRERQERAVALDEVRLRLNALQEALTARTHAAHAGTSGQQVALGVMALEAALQAGRPCARELALLRSACGPAGDQLVEVAVASVPAEAAARGIPSHAQLVSSLSQVRRAASELVLLPAGSGGVVAHLLAKAARLLRVDEAGAVAALGTEEGGAQARLAAAERLAAAGQYREASQQLLAATSGSRAEEVVQQWVAQARARALVDQALQLLQARAATLAASLAA